MKWKIITLIFLVSLIPFLVASTTIKLQNNETENLEDTRVDSQNPDAERGAHLWLLVGNTVNLYHTMIKFNISSIPLGMAIEDAQLYLYFRGETLEGGEGGNISIYHVYSFPQYNVSNEEWIEGNSSSYTEATPPEVSYNTRPNTSAQMNMTPLDTITISDGDSFGYYNWNVTNAVSLDYDSSKKNISFILNATMINGATQDNILFWSKENESTSYMPYLNITYSEVVSNTTPRHFYFGDSTFKLGDGRFILR